MDQMIGNDGNKYKEGAYVSSFMTPTEFVVRYRDVSQRTGSVKVQRIGFDCEPECTSN